jgi:L-ascorbate metabolism protein UlaG (beta-lactamase superfamily)
MSPSKLAKLSMLSAVSLGLLAATAAQAPRAELTYIGRASVKIKTVSGLVIYIDPYAAGDYSEPADLVLVTHGHSDHNNVKLTTLKQGAVVAAPARAVSVPGAIVVAEGSAFEAGGGMIKILALPAANKNHARSSGVGYLVSFDGVVLYHAGDTDYLPEMEGYGKYGIGYALLPCDGFYNMGPEEAARCAAAMKAKRVVPIHSSPSGAFDEKKARAVGAEGLLVLKPGEKAELSD